MATKKMEMKPGLRLGVVKPRDTIDFFAEKKLLLPSYSWQDIWQAEHGAGVAVAGIMQQEVLQLFADELARAIEVGGDLPGFRKRMQEALQKRGLWGRVQVTDPISGETRFTNFDRNRLELIFDTNLRQAQAAGQWRRIMDGQRLFPYLRYDTMRDSRVRAAHKQFEGVTLPVGHPFWRTHMPPNGWRCRCSVMQVSERDLERLIKLGVPIKREAPQVDMVEFANRRTGEITRTPRGIDPGFGYNPGAQRAWGILPHEVPASRVQPDATAPALWPATPLQDLPRLPAPRSTAGTMLMQPGQSDQAYVDALLRELGTNEAGMVELQDEAGQALVLSAEMFVPAGKRAPVWADGQRERYTKLVAKTLATPDEIWLTNSMARRYIARYQVDAMVITIVFDLDAQAWSTIVLLETAQSRAQSEAQLQALRSGKRIYPDGD